MTRHPLSFAICSCVALAALLLVPESAVANGILVSADPSASGGRRGGVRLVRHDVKARMQDHVVRVVVEHTFQSDARVPLEGTYLFPLPEGAIVSKFAMTMGGKMVQGEVIEADRARAIYDAIVRRRQDPGLLEYMGRGLFRARVFPIPAGGRVRIRLAFQQVLPQDRGVLELRYPLATDRLNGTPVDEVSLDIRVASSVDIKGIYSPSHDLAIERDGERAARVRIERSARRQTQDLLLYVSRTPEAVGFSVLSNKGAGEDGTFMAVLAPQNTADESVRVPKDVVFVLDTSGSMAGEKLQQAQAALAYGVHTLKEGDRFNVLDFATGVMPFRDGLIEATNEGKQAAIRWIDERVAQGSTHISKALADALAMHSPKRLSLVVLLTDGRPTVGLKEADALVRHVTRANHAQARVFTFGVGHDLDVTMLDRIAAETGGARDYVAPGEDIEIVTSRLFNKVVHPVLTNVKVDLGPGVYDVYPAEIPDLFAGSQVVVYGRYKAPGPRVMKLAGDVAGKRVVHEYAAAFAKDEACDVLPRLWAHRKVVFLLDQVRLHGESKEVRGEIIRLATRYAIVTPYTAGLVLEEDELGRGVASANPLFQVGGRRAPTTPTTPSLGHRSRYRGPSGAVPPALREPLDPTPPPGTPPPAPPPSTGPALVPPGGSTAPGAATKASKDLRRRKDASREIEDEHLRGLRERITTVAGKTFVLRKGGRWVDTAWDRKQETVRVVAFSRAYFELLRRKAIVAKYLALGKRVVFVLEETAYEIVPAPK